MARVYCDGYEIKVTAHEAGKGRNWRRKYTLRVRVAPVWTTGKRRVAALIYHEYGPERGPIQELWDAINAGELPEMILDRVRDRFPNVYLPRVV